MSNGRRKRIKAYRQAVESLGFQVTKVTLQKGSSHLKFYITDDAGNNFFVFTGYSCSADERTMHQNFKRSVRRQSNVMKGLIE